MAETKNYPLKKRPIHVVCDYVADEPEQDEPVDLCIKRVKYDDDVKPEIALKPINNNTIRSQHSDSAFSFENSECEKYLQSKYTGHKSTSPQHLYDMLPGYHYDRYYHENAVPIKQEYPASNQSRERDYSVSPDYSLPKTPVEFYSKHFVKEERYSQPSSRYAPYPLKHNSTLHEQYHMASSPNSLNSIGSPRSSVSPLSTSSINEELYHHHMTKSSAVSYEITEVPQQYCEAKSETAQRYQCTECGKSYSTYSGLTKHTQFHCPAIEGNQAKKTYDCEYCDKVYTSSGALKMHIRTHTLPCKCQICGKAFSRPWLLQGHIRTHTGEKPFSCQYCQRAFADRSNLRAHLQTHSDVKKYSCTTCVKTFSRMSLLTKHTEGGCAGLHRSLSPQYI